MNTDAVEFYYYMFKNNAFFRKHSSQYSLDELMKMNEMDEDEEKGNFEQVIL